MFFLIEPNTVNKPCPTFCGIYVNPCPKDLVHPLYGIDPTPI